MRSFSTLVCLLAACLALLFVYRTTLTEKIIANRILAMGAEDVQLSVAELGSRKFLVSSLQASFPKDTALKSVQLQNLALRYTFPELLKGDIEALEIDALQITPGQHEKKSSRPAPQQNLRAYLPKTIAVQDLTLSLPGVAEGLSIQLSVDNRTEASMDIQFRLEGKEISTSGWQVASLGAELNLQTDLTSFIHFQENSHVEVEGVEGASAHLYKAHVQLSGRLKNVPGSGWRSGHQLFFLTSQGLSIGDMELESAPVAIKLGDGFHPGDLRSHIHTADLLLRWKDKELPLQDIKIDLVGDRDKLQLDLLLSHAHFPGRLAGKLTHSLQEGRGGLELKTVLPLELGGENSQLLTQLLSRKKLPLTLDTCSVDLDGKLQWEDKSLVSGQADLQVSSGAGTYNNISFQGLTLQQSLQVFPEIRSLKQGSLRLTEINPGLAINNIKLHNRFLPAVDEKFPAILIDSMQAEILGAELSSEQLSIDPNQGSLDMPIRFRGIDLARLVSLKKLDGLTATGIVDGNIHLEYGDGQFSIREGELQSSSAGGTISYLPPGGAASLSQLPPIAVKALEEFQYTTLTATPRYAADGTLTFIVHMEGSSPPLNTDRPVHLNLNLEQNLLSLLKSLRYSKGLTDDLEKGLQNGHRKE